MNERAYVRMSIRKFFRYVEPIKNKKMSKTKYVAFSTQKGGAGKTTLTVIVASYLHYVKGYNVAVIDCDFPQYSIHDMRKRDRAAIVEDEHYKVQAYEQIKRLNKSPYPVLCSRAEDAIKTADNLAARTRTLILSSLTCRAQSTMQRWSAPSPEWTISSARLSLTV